MLRNRLLYIRGDDGNFIGPQLATTGIPQGSPLSTLLFNVYIADLFKLNLKDIKIIGYADDIVLVTQGKDIDSMTAKLNLALDKVNLFLKDNDLSLAVNKCEAMSTRSRQNGTSAKMNKNELWVQGDRVYNSASNCEYGIIAK